MPSHLRTVPAIAHIAPTAAMIPARIEKQPAAVVPPTLPDFVERFARNQQIRGGSRDRTKGGVQSAVFTTPFPAEPTLAWRDPQAREATSQLGIQLLEVNFLWFSLSRASQENSINRFA